MRPQSWLFVLILTLGSLGLSSCASTSQGRLLEGVHEGMDKDLVLEKAGDPKRTFRANSQDHWIYVYFENDEEWRRQIDFKNGKVNKVGAPVAKKNWVSDLENTNSMEEFESKARAHQKKAGDFKPIDGQ